MPIQSSLSMVGFRKPLYAILANRALISLTVRILPCREAIDDQHGCRAQSVRQYPSGSYRTVDSVASLFRQEAASVRNPYGALISWKPFS